MSALYPEIKKEWKLKSSVVYGPFPTRRKGMAIGINVLALDEKFCSFDCVYCQCGWTRDFDPALARTEHYLSLDEIKKELDLNFSRIKENAQVVDSIVLSGNGEPTLHPQFDKAVELLLEVRDRYFPEVKVQCLTAGTELHRPEVIEGLNHLDRPTFKLDAVDAKQIKIINRPLVPYSVDDLEKKLQNIDNIYLQSCFFDGRISNVGNESLSCYYEIVSRLHPIEVEIYSIHRSPPAKGLKAVDVDFLHEIARNLKEKADIITLVV